MTLLKILRNLVAENFKRSLYIKNQNPSLHFLKLINREAHCCLKNVNSTSLNLRMLIVFPLRFCITQECQLQILLLITTRERQHLLPNCLIIPHKQVLFLFITHNQPAFVSFFCNIIIIEIGIESTILQTLVYNQHTNLTKMIKKSVFLILLGL